MASKKITITLPDKQVAAIRDLVARNQADSASAFVRHAVGLALDDVAGWQRALADALEESGDPLTENERKWADGVLGGARRSVA